MTIDDQAPPGAIEGSSAETAGRLILNSFGWLVLAMSAPALIGWMRGSLPAFVAAASHGAVKLQIPPVVDRLLVTLYVFSSASVFLWASCVRGRVVGNGDRARGLALVPIAWFPLTILAMVVVATYGMLMDFLVHTVRPDRFAGEAALPPWLILFDVLTMVVLAPLAEELFFRGFLWTGLRRHWSAPLTALFTAAAWLALHVNVAQIMFLVLPALVISAARHVSRSVRSPILIHATYNLVVNGPVVGLMLGLLGQPG